MIRILEGVSALSAKKRSACLLCGKPSTTSICGHCSDRVNSEAVHKKKKEEKKK